MNHAVQSISGLPPVSTGSIIPRGEQATLALSGDVVRVAIIDVGPERAKAWLAKEHPTNRRTAAPVSAYADSMSAEQWKLTPEPLIFSRSGVLMNGGNRLRAIIKSGCTVTLVVWFNWPEEAYAVIDRGRSRTLLQADRMAGTAMRTEAYQLAREMLRMSGRRAYGDYEVRTMAEKFVTPVDDVIQAIGHTSLRRHWRTGTLLSFSIAMIADRDTTFAFIQEAERARAHEIVPSVQVRNYLRWYDTFAIGKRQASNDEIAYATAAALKHARLGTEVQFVKPTREAWRYWRDEPNVIDVFGHAQ